MEGYRWNPTEMGFDDTVCVVCGAKLPEVPVEGTPEFDGYCSDECKARENDTMMPLYEVEPLTHTVSVRWEEDEEETPVLVTAQEYEVLREIVGAEVDDDDARPCVCGCGKMRRVSAADEVL